MTLLNSTNDQTDGGSTLIAGAAHDSELRRLGGRWPFAAFVAGPGLIAFWAVGGKFFDSDVTDQGNGAVYEAIKDLGTGTHISLSLGFIGVIAFALFAQGLIRFFDSRTPAGSGAGSLARLGLTAAVGLAVLTASFKAIYRGGLPDHGDSSMYTHDSVATLHIINDQLQYTGLWPLTFAMLAVAALWFQHKTLPRWYGVLSGLMAVATILMAVVAGLPYFAGIVGPLWIIASGVVVLRHRNRPVGIAR
jgi:hypothetical protein